MKNSNDAMKFISFARQQAGEGVSADLFTKTNSDEIAALQIHIDAVKKSLGDLISQENFEVGSLTKAEAKKMYAEVRAKAKEVIKNDRVSRHVQIHKDGENKRHLYYQEDSLTRKITLPTQFYYCREAVLDLLEARQGKISHQ